MHILILIGVLFVAGFICKKFSKVLSNTILVLALVVCLIYTSHATGVLVFLPSDADVTMHVANSGYMYLESGASASLSESFVFDDSIESSDIDDWCSVQTKNIYLGVKSGSDVLYYKNMGTYEDVKGSELISIYNNWKKSSTLPIDYVRYHFLGFYFDV